MLDGWRDAQTADADGSFEAQIVPRQLHIALLLLRAATGGPVVGGPLGIRPDLMRFLAVEPAVVCQI